MASRDIANMHLFLEMKKKFPELPEDLIRRYVTKHSEDHEMCLQLLNKENQNHLCSSQPFADIPLSDHLSSININKGISSTAKQRGGEVKLSCTNRIPCGQSIVFTTQQRLHHLQPHQASPQQPTFSASVNGHHFGSVGFSHFLSRASKAEERQEDPLREEIIGFAATPTTYPFSNKACVNQKHVYRDRIIESTCQPKGQESRGSIPSFADIRSGSVCPSTSQVKRHAVKLSLTPAPPLQYYDVYPNPIAATASRSSAAGKHTTSVNLQLRRPASDQHPIEIMTSPISKDSTSDLNDFDSHVQISISSTGASFTARRLLKSKVSQFHPTSLPGSPVSQFPSTSLAVSPVHRHSSKSPKRPDFLDIPSTSTQSLRSKPSFSTETRQPNPMSSSRLKLLGLHSDVPFLSEIPKGLECTRAKADWLHFLPSPYQGEIFSMSNWPISNQKHFPSFDAPENTSPSTERTENEELIYIQVLLEHQRARMDMLREELSQEKEVRAKLRIEVSSMEHTLSERRMCRTTFSQMAELQKLREENRNLRVECNCLLMEVDLCNAGQVPLGMTDEDFYSNIFTGPRGPIPPVREERKRGSPSLQIPGKTETTKIDFPMLLGSSNEENESDDDDDEKNKWRCKKCTFENHPAMEKCEICELPRTTSYIDCTSNYCQGADSGFVPSPEDRVNMLTRRAIGSVQICVTQNVPSSSSKGLKLQLTHRVHR